MASPRSQPMRHCRTFAAHSELILIHPYECAGEKKERDMSQTISDVFVEHLVQAGVQRIYGIVGDSLNPVVDAVRRNGQLQWIHVRHEEEAAFAAGAEAQLSGNLAAW